VELKIHIKKIFIFYLYTKERKLFSHKKKMMIQKKFTELTPWQKLIRKVAEEHPEYKSNRQRVEEAKRIWLSTRPRIKQKKVEPPRPVPKKVSSYKPPPPPEEFEAITPWQKHYYKVAHENPQLVTTKQKHKLAYQLWMVENGSDKDFQRYLDLNF
jgi:hypothetical protein